MCADRPVVLDRDEILADSDWRPPPHEGIEVLPFGLLDFDLVMNHGAVFGIGQDQRTIFIIFTITAVTLASSSLPSVLVLDPMPCMSVSP